MERLVDGKNLRFRPQKWLGKEDHGEGHDMQMNLLGYVVVISITILMY